MFEIKNLRVDKNIDNFLFFISEKEEISPEAKTDEIKGTAADFETWLTCVHRKFWCLDKCTNNLSPNEK